MVQCQNPERDKGSWQASQESQKNQAESNWNFFERVKNSVTKLIRNTKQLYIKTKIAENKNNSWKLWNLSKCLSNDNKSAEHGLNNLIGNEKNIKKWLWLFIVVNNNKS